MRVTLNAEIVMVLEDEDSAEEFRHEVEASLAREWVKFPETGETATVRIKRIDAD